MSPDIVPYHERRRLDHSTTPPVHTHLGFVLNGMTGGLAESSVTGSGSAQLCLPALSLTVMRLVEGELLPLVEGRHRCEVQPLNATVSWISRGLWGSVWYGDESILSDVVQSEQDGNVGGSTYDRLRSKAADAFRCQCRI